MNDNHDEQGRFASGSEAAYHATKAARAKSRDENTSHVEKVAAHMDAGRKHEAMAAQYEAREKTQVKPDKDANGNVRKNSFVTTAESEDSHQKARDHLKNAKAHFSMAEKHAREGIVSAHAKIQKLDERMAMRN